MPRTIKIDFVSDVVCPWCAVGLASLLQAMARIGPALDVGLHFQPFELNPDMPAEGEDAVEHLVRKYGISAEQVEANGQMLQRRGAELGFEFNLHKRRRVYNSFDAHRLLHWAGTLGAGLQLALKRELLAAYFTEGEDIAASGVLVACAGRVGLDAGEAADVLGSGRFAAEVRASEDFYRQQGINAVPSIIFDDRHLVQGGQPVEVFEQILRQLAELPAAGR